jgi:hypothetical protein
MMLFKKYDPKNKNKIFIDSGFVDSQYLWLLPTVDGYCKKLGIKKIIFQRKLSSRLKKNSFIKNFLKNYEIEYLEKKYFIIFKLAVLALSIVLFPFFYFKIKRSRLLSEKNWFKLQFNHAIWDTSLKLGKDGDLSPSTKNKFKSFYFINYNLLLSNLLKINHSIHTSFLSHSVYQGRIFLASLRKYCTVICQSAFNLYKQPRDHDEAWSILTNKKNLDLILKVVSNNDAAMYWDNRLTGKGKFYESNVINKFNNKNIEDDINVIMLHVFRDSAFNFIDKERIYADYIDWVYSTLEILKKSEEKWYIRMHPFSYRWGEDSLKFLHNIKKKLKLGNENFIVLEDNISNNLIFKNAKKIVTYSGTAFLEFACYGKKSIIISDVLPKQYQNQIAIKPNSKNHYEKLLLEEIKNNDFILKDSEILLSKKILFSRENITNLASDTGGFFTYRSDKIDLIEKEFKQVELKVKENLELFKQLGSKYSNNEFTHSVSMKFNSKIKF